MRRTFPIALSVLLGGCQWIPGTEANQSEKAKDFVAQVLRDPDSAQFRNVRVGKAKAKDDGPAAMVCGEVNGKNAMGAYAGFARFMGDVDGKDAMIDPQLTDGEVRHASALELCGLRRSADCPEAEKINDEIGHQAGFNAMWDSYCAG